MSKSKRAASKMYRIALDMASRNLAADMPPFLSDLLKHPVHCRRFDSLLGSYQRGCQKKVKYQSQHSAQRAIIAFVDKGDPLLIEYECAFCGGWHIGHFTMARCLDVNKLKGRLYSMRRTI